MGLESYNDPVAKLLAYGKRSISDRNPWPDYRTELGLTSVDVPELIRMALDPIFDELDSNGTEIWAPVHAMQALGQLQATEAIAPLISVLAWDDDYTSVSLPLVFGMIGAEAIAPLMDFIHIPQQNFLGKTRAVRAIAAIPTYHAELREQCITLLKGELHDPETLDDGLISILVDQLIKLRATEALPEIERAFATGQVDELLTGSWAQVQVTFGLKQKSDFTAEELQPKVPEVMKQIGKMLNLLERQLPPPSKGFGTRASLKKGKKTKKKK